MDEPMKQCTRKGGKGGPCTKMFPTSDPRKQCPDCREWFRLYYQKNKVAHKARQTKHHSKPGGKEKLALKARKWRLTESGKESTHTSNNAPATKARVALWKTTEKGQASMKAGAKKQNAKMTQKLSISLWDMVSGRHPNPVSLVSLGCFSGNDDASSHFASTFEPWMNFGNQGAYHIGDEYNVKWNIGHRLPRAIFDPLNREDLAKCFDRRNLYAQCARHNVESNRKLVLSNVELEALRPIWPAKAMGNLFALKALFV